MNGFLRRRSQWLLCVVVAATTIACATTGTTRTGERPVGTSGAVPATDSVPLTESRHEVPVGQQLDARLQQPLSSATAAVEDRFEATTIADLIQGESVLIPAGSLVRGIVQSVQPATRLNRTSQLTLRFDRITVRGREYPIRAMATDVYESGGLETEAPRIGTGAGVGGIIGGILGGVKGALAGILIGAGGTIAATEGTDVVLPAGTIVRIRFDSPLRLESAT
jgi:hypothetical protein